MAEGSAQNELKVKKANQHPAVAEQRLRVFPADFFCGFFQPTPAGKDSDGRQNAEHCLTYGCMCGGNGGRQKIQDCQSSKHSLNDYASDSANRQPAHPAATVNAPGPDGDYDRHQADEFCDHPVRMLKLYSADHLRNFEEMAKACGPIGDGQSGVIAGNKATGNQQEKSKYGDKYSKTMLSGVISGGGQNCSLRVPAILTT
jgi:hypothetical protein